MFQQHTIACEGGVAGLLVETWLPGGTQTTDLSTNLLRGGKSTVREQPRHTAGYHQPGDPSVYYYHSWASPPFYPERFISRKGRASSCL